MSGAGRTPGEGKPCVGLFVTCLVDLYRPSVGFAAMRLLDHAGFDVVVPAAQTCCGQPAYNAGDRRGAAAVIRSALGAFDDCTAIVVPSGSCAGMLRYHVPGLFPNDPRAARFAAKVEELTAFLARVGAVPPGRIAGTVTYHDGCSGLREMGVHDQPRALLRAAGATIAELPDADVCCGFGGLFCVKYPEISTRMAEAKAAAIVATGAETVLAGDMGCLLNIAGTLSRRGAAVAVRHVAEMLAGEPASPPLGAAVS